MWAIVRRIRSGSGNRPAPASAATRFAGPAHAWERFAANRLAVLGAVVIGLLLVFVIVVPIIAPQDPDAIDFSASLAPPGSPAHWLGADQLGRDLLARLVTGGRLSLAIGVSVALGSSAVGAVLGAVAGFYRGTADIVISRTILVLLSLPLLPLLMVIGGSFAVGPEALVALLVATGWGGVARLVRAQVLSLREAEFVLAARAIGVSGPRIVLRHLLPNVMAPVTVAATLAVAYTILTESALSYLGYGVRPPRPPGGTCCSTPRPSCARHRGWRSCRARSSRSPLSASAPSAMAYAKHSTQG